MRPRLVNGIHRWVALSASLFLSCWLVSGLVMIIPIDWLTRGKSETKEGRPDSDRQFSEVSVSVPQALAAISSNSTSPAIVREIKLKRVGNTIAYEIVTTKQGVLLVDAFNGQVFKLSEQAAEKRARAFVDPSARLLRVSLQEQQDFFFHGGTPAFRFEFDDARRSRVHVSQADGRVHHSTRLSRLHRSVTSLHTLEPLLSFVGQRRYRVAILFLGGLLAIAAVGSGLYLSLPVRWRR